MNQTVQNVNKEDVENQGIGMKRKYGLRAPRPALTTININRTTQRRHSDIPSIHAAKCPRIKTPNVPRIIVRPDEEKGPKTPSAEEALPEGVEDIDSGHGLNNPLDGHPYTSSIYKYLRRLELEYRIQDDHLQGQQITGKLRAILVDWLCDVCYHFKLSQDALHLTINLLDRFMEVDKSTTKENLQLVGMAAIFVAAKYEEVFPLDASDLTGISDGAFTAEELLKTEEALMTALDFRLGAPTAVTFLRRYTRASKGTTYQHAYAKYFIDLALLEYEFCPVERSMMAAVATYLALCVTESRTSGALWSPALVHYSGYYYRDFDKLVPSLAKTIVQATDSKLRAIRNRYATSEKLAVSIMPCLLPDTGIISQLLRS